MPAPPPCFSPLGPHGGQQQGWSGEATKWVARGRLLETARDGGEGGTLLWPRGISFNGGNGGKNPPQRHEEGERSRAGEGGEKYTRGGVHGSLVQPGSSICKYIYASPHLRLGAFSWQMHKTPLADTRPPPPQPETDPPACRGMRVGEEKCRRGLGFALGWGFFSPAWAARVGTPAPVPLDGRRPLAGRPLRSPQPRRPSRPRYGASRLSSIPAGFLGGSA